MKITCFHQLITNWTNSSSWYQIFLRGQVLLPTNLATFLKLIMLRQMARTRLFYFSWFFLKTLKCRICIAALQRHYNGAVHVSSLLRWTKTLPTLKSGGFFEQRQVSKLIFLHFNVDQKLLLLNKKTQRHPYNYIKYIYFEIKFLHHKMEI